MHSQFGWVPFKVSVWQLRWKTVSPSSSRDVGRSGSGVLAPAHVRRRLPAEHQTACSTGWIYADVWSFKLTTWITSLGL